MENSIDDFLSKSSQAEQDKFKGLVADAVNKDATPQNVKDAQKTAEKNDPTKGNEQTPEQTQTAENAVDRALDKQTKGQVVEIGQTLSKEGVTAPPPQKEQERER